MGSSFTIKKICIRLFIVLYMYVKPFRRLFSTKLVSGGWIHWFSFFFFFKYVFLCFFLFATFYVVVCTHKCERTSIETHKCQLKNVFGLKVWKLYWLNSSYYSYYWLFYTRLSYTYLKLLLLRKIILIFKNDHNCVLLLANFDRKM